MHKQLISITKHIKLNDQSWNKTKNLNYDFGNGVNKIILFEL